MLQKTESELRDGLRILAYEVNMLHGIFAYYPKLRESATSGDCLIGGARISEMPQFTENVYLESFLVHARNLIAFLRYNGKDTRHPLDIYAAHYFTTPEEWLHIRGEMPKSLKGIYLRAHTRLAHISLARLEDTPETKPWNLAGIVNDLKPLLQKFYDNIPLEIKGG